MANHRRIFIPGLSSHVIQRGNNHSSIFRDDCDYQFLLALLRRSASNHGVDVHGFVLMTTHIHMLTTPTGEKSLPRMMQQMGCTYARYYNRRYDRVGTLWNGRYRSIPIENEQYWLTCLRYIEQNPVRAGIVTRPDAYRWSSYAAHARGEWPDWLTRHRVYLELGNDDAEREAAYRAICGLTVRNDELVPIRYAVSALHAGGASEVTRRNLRLTSDTPPTSVE